MQPSPRHRVIILGASNVAMGMSVVVDTARRVWGQPLDVLAAIGHGRSYGQMSRVLGRSLPGILQCDVWDEWQARAPLPTASLLTDIGNDILFGAEPAQIASWVRMCLVRLSEACERMAVTELPMESVSQLGPRRFLAMRAVLFPRSRITWDQALDRAWEVNQLVVELAGEFGATVVRPERRWYGLDPIHIRAEHRRQAWRNILAAWRPCDSTASSPLTLRERLAWWKARPKYRRLLGMEQRRAQPTIEFADGTNVSLY